MQTLDDVARLTAALHGRYTIEREIGRGGMAIVYRARDERHQRWVALKVLRPELQAALSVQRFLAEIRVTANLQHPNLVPLFDSGEVEGIPYYVMPCVEGESLRVKLQREKQLPVEEAIRIAATVADALDYAHRRGVIHRDLKPENILLEDGKPVVADFGIALAVSNAGGDRITQTGALGTPDYMSPEQAMGERSLTPPSDVYSLAVVLYEMLTGRLPYSGSSPRAVIASQIRDHPATVRSVRSGVPQDVDATVMQALAKAPDERFRSAGAFASALLAASAKAPSTSATRKWAIPFLGVAAIVAAIWMPIGRSATPAAVEPDVVRLTTSGDANDPSLSPDGQRLAYTTVECDPDAQCTVNLVVKDIAGAGMATLVRGLHAVNGTEWSHDGRYILVNTTTADGKWGVFVVPALGGDFRFLGCCQGWFVPGSDTVLLNTHRVGVDSASGIHRVLVADGRLIETVSIPQPDGHLYAEPFVNGRLLVHSWRSAERRSLVSVVDRDGRILDSLDLPLNRRVFARAWPSGNAILMTIRREDRPGVFVVAYPVTPGGRIAQRPDTLLQQLDVPRIVPTTTGGLLYSAGTTAFEVWSSQRDNARATLGKEVRLATSTGILLGSVDPTGTTIALSRETAPGSRMRQLSIRPFDGGPERPVGPPMELTGWVWEPTGRSMLVLVARGPDSTEVRRVQLANGQSSTLRVAPRLGWIWTSAAGGYWVLNANADTMWVSGVSDQADTVITRPAPWMTWQLGSPSPDGRHFAFMTWDKGQDSLLLLRTSLNGAGVRRLATFSGQIGAPVSWLSDGTLIAQIQEAGTNALYRVASDGSGSRKLGLLPRKGATASFSADGFRAVLNAMDSRNDIYFVRNFAKLLDKR